MTVNLILMIVALLFLLVLLVAIYVWGTKKKSPLSPATPDTPQPPETFESLCAVIRNRSSGSAQLNHAVEAILERFGHISAKSLTTYTELLEALCLHPSTNSKLILKFEKTLRTLNPDFASEIEHALTRGLAARG